MEQRIISLDDVNEVWPVSVNLDDNKVNAAILRAQQSDLKPILGEALYHAFIEDYNGTDFVDPNYALLFSGGEYTYGNYTIYFSGVKALLSCYAFTRIVDAARINVVRSGSVWKEEDESDQVEDYQERINRRRALEDSQRLKEELERYLYENTDLYPLYNQRRRQSTERTAFRFIKV
jgi:hypothetical protein